MPRSIWRVGTKKAAKQPTTHKTDPTITLPRRPPIVPMLRNPHSRPGSLCLWWILVSWLGRVLGGHSCSHWEGRVCHSVHRYRFMELL